MPQYRNPSLESAARLNTLASATFDQGTAARDTAERYVRDTVLFASVLFLVAIAQRFKVRGTRRDHDCRVCPGCLHFVRGGDPATDLKPFTTSKR